MKHVVIYRNNTGWVFRFGVARYEFKRLIDALRAAELLQIHVSNRKQLPA